MTYNANVKFSDIKLYDTDYIEYSNNIPNLTGKQLERLSVGYTMGDYGGNNFLMSSVSSKEFEYSMDAEIITGDRFSLVFGAQTNNIVSLKNNASPYAAIEFRTTASGINLKLFDTDNTYFSSVVSPIVSSKFSVSVGFDEEQGLTMKIDGEKVDLSSLLIIPFSI